MHGHGKLTQTKYVLKDQMAICKNVNDNVWDGTWSNGKSCKDNDDSNCCSFYGPISSLLTMKQWKQYGPYWHLPKFARKVS